MALDQRSHGESEGPDTGYGFADVTGDLGAFLEACGLEKPILAGHSWGCNVALEFGALNPGAASGLVFVDGGFINVGGGPGVTWEDVEQNLAPPDLTHLTIEALVARAKENRWSDNWRPEVEAVLRASFQTRPDGTILPRLRKERHMQIVRAMWDQPSRELFPKVDVPVLILPARRQEEQPRTSLPWIPKEELVATAESSLPQARTVWLEDSIHDVPLQRPALVASVILEALDEGFFG
jgi:pimeloyl-ACP methyl ester carboxylesterase